MPKYLRTFCLIIPKQIFTKFKDTGFHDDSLMDFLLA